MGFYQDLIKGSPNHKARELSRRGDVQIAAVDSTEEALHRFQPIANDARDRCDEVLNEHTSSMYSGDLYDILILRFEHPDETPASPDVGATDPPRQLSQPVPSGWQDTDDGSQSARNIALVRQRQQRAAVLANSTATFTGVSADASVGEIRGEPSTIIAREVTGIMAGTDRTPTPLALATALPDQSPAPVLVEERNGKIVLASDRDSLLLSSEADFNGWREPIIEHVHELSSGEFREGTNHSRVRDRLVALGNLLPGGITEVKERQFRIGYEIERFEGLISAYRSGADDMPMLNAAILEDLDRLRVALKMGIEKLERWAEFRREAAVDAKHEGDANPNEVGEALDKMAAEMERQPKYFDPELPASFRFLVEAIEDRVGATKTVVYGAVKSAENVFSFLGQRALGIATAAFDGVEQHISKAIAKALILVLGGAALQLSGALPTTWAWLKPLLELLAKASH